MPVGDGSVGALGGTGIELMTSSSVHFWMAFPTTAVPTTND